MDQGTCDRIRHLYFVERVAVRARAELLSLSPRAVRGALVLSGGIAAPRGPEPETSALAGEAPDARRAR